MPSLSSPWFQQTGSATMLQPHVVRSPSSNSMSDKEISELTTRVSRPTTSSQAKKTQSWKLQNNFMEQGRHSWAKMELFEDCKKCIWTPSGTVKHTCKIRPIKPSSNQNQCDDLEPWFLNYFQLRHVNSSLDYSKGQ